MKVSKSFAGIFSVLGMLFVLGGCGNSNPTTAQQPLVSCPAGYTASGTTCVAAAQTAYVAPTPACPVGTTYTNGACYCNAGTLNTAAGCMAQSGTCPTGTAFYVNQCMTGQTAGCPAGQLYINSACQPLTGTCSAGSAFYINQCIPANNNPVTSFGGTTVPGYNPIVGQNTCPNGQQPGFLGFCVTFFH